MKRRRIDVVKVYKGGGVLRLFHDFVDIQQAEEAVRFLNANEESTRNGLYYVVEDYDD